MFLRKGFWHIILVGLNLIGKEVSNQILDFGNFIRNSFGGGMDYSGLGPRMTKWDGNTMGADESLNAKFNAVMFADGLMTAGVANIGSSSSGKLNILSAEEMSNIWGAGPLRIDPQNPPKTVTSDFIEILAGGGTPRLDELGIQKTVQFNFKWRGALEWEIKDIPGSIGLNNSRIVQHPDGRWGLIINHDYKKIINLPTNSALK
ncbi:hypothetical protein SD427_14165 [Chryseobacterium sp. JJR-5R]|uniref:hypothetical protein n=1 Tax=Chryseobacterium sp. JJR-5R TaxID=3093923 RepID=UPI002A7661D8|nr:hypothetical protein [Chryseobacterium sp. JJR-5R]WPO81904.1 hypothetical protein SD427_14165 [Chryseobacterium sp. JJR-5R]